MAGMRDYTDQEIDLLRKSFSGRYTLRDGGFFEMALQMDLRVPVGQGFASRVLLWSAKGGFLDLTAAVNDPHWAFISAQDLNNRGQVVVWGEYRGELRGVRVTPHVVNVVRSRLGR